MEKYEVINFRRSALIEAVEEGNIKKVKELIDKGTDIEYKDAVGYTAFHRSIFSMLKEGNGRNIKRKRQEIINILYDNGANIDSEIKSFNSFGVTPLKSAIILNDKDSVKKLIELGADVNKEDKLDPYSPLMRAIAHSDSEIIKTIVEAGADVQYRNSVGEGLLHVFCMSNREDVLNNIRMNEVSFRLNINDKTKQGMTPLMVACIYGNIEMINYLVNSGADLNIKDTKGNNALIWTITNPLKIDENDRIDIIKILLENNCAFKETDNKKISSLEWSISKGYFKIAKLIMNKYKDGENIVFKRGGTPIHYAVSSRSKLKERIDFIDEAVKKGCDINYLKDEKGLVPLNIVVAHLMGTNVDKIIKDDLVKTIIKNGGSIVKSILVSKRLKLNQEIILESMI